MILDVFQRAGDALSRVSRRIVPDPFVLAIGLNLLIIAVGAAFLVRTTEAGAGAIAWTVADAWLEGFANPAGLEFALQMALVLVTGHALATSPPVQRLVTLLARVPRNSAGAAALVALTSCAAAVIHWGLGAIVGAFVAREIAQAARAEGREFDYAVLGAAAYAGLAVWHGGLSGSAPLKVAQDGHFLQDWLGVVPVGETIFALPNLLITGALVATITGLFWLVAPRDRAQPGPHANPIPTRAAPTPATARERGLVGWLQGSALPGTLVGLAGLALVLSALAVGLVSLDINGVNALFLFLGVALQGSLGRYAEAVAEGARGVGAIVVQFPFYFALLGVMSGTGLVAWASDALASLATAQTFPLIAFVSAGLVNLFVPSGGGQWAVQGKILASTGAGLGVEPETTVMAFAYGDAWTNMLQPFWALPLLGIMGLRARDIMGYSALVFAVMGLLVPALLLALH